MGKAILRSRDNSEFRWGYDTEMVSNLTAVFIPVRWHILARKVSIAVLNVVVEQAGLISLPLVRRLAFLLVLQDRSD